MDDCLGKDASSPAAAQPPNVNQVGQSVFYDCIDLSPAGDKPGDNHNDANEAVNDDDDDDDSECEHFARPNTNTIELCAAAATAAIAPHNRTSADNDDDEPTVSDIDQDCTIFAGVTYLGAATINAPKSKVEIQRNMAELNATAAAADHGMKVSVSIPSCSEGVVV